jgi:hypothetical protein
MSAALTNECRKTTIISIVDFSSYFEKRQKKTTDWVDLMHRRENDFVTHTPIHYHLFTQG